MKGIWRFFASLRLTILLTFLITVDALTGIFIISLYSEDLGRMDQTIFFSWLFEDGIKNLHLTWWIFLLLLLIALFAMNTLVCTINSVFSILDFNYPWRMKIRKFLAQIVHIGFVITLMGHLLSSLSGFRSPENYIFEGEALNIPEGEGLAVRLKKLDVSSSDTGVMERMEARVSLIKDGEKVKEEIIGPNNPLLYKGISVYLVHHGVAPVGIELDISGNDVYGRADITFREGVTSFKDYRIRLGPFIPDFAIDRAGRPYSASREFRNPAQRLEVYKGEDLMTAGWLFFLHPQRFSLTFDGYRLSFSRILYRPYAVLDINRDPGTIVALIGTILFMTALTALLFIRGEGMELVPNLEG